MLKGLGILFVITNHCFARGTRKFGTGPITEDPILYFGNRFIHFAVPLFLFISCALLTRSLVKSFDIPTYSKNRWRKTVVPYLVASLAYYLLTSWPALNSVEAYRDLVVQVLTGKAYFHLYFTVVLIQASILVPLLMKFVRSRVLEWRHALFLAMILQWAVFQLQREILQTERPGSFIFWYLVPLFLGVAVGTDQGLKERLKPSSRWLFWTSVFFGLAYSSASIVHLFGWSASSDLINGLYSAYTGVLAITLWVVCDHLPRGKSRVLLSRLGRVSLPLFLIHPAIMYLMGGPRITAVLAPIPGAGVIYWFIVLAVSYLCAILLLRLRLGRLLLGEPPRNVSVDTA